MSNTDGTPLTWTSEDDEIVTLKKQLAEAQNERDAQVAEKIKAIGSYGLEAIRVRDLQENLADARQALTMIQFIGTKGTARIWPDKVLQECVGIAANALKENL